MTYIIKRKFKLTNQEAQAYKTNMPFNTCPPVRITSYLLPSPPGRAWTIEMIQGAGTYFRSRPFSEVDDCRKNTERKIQLQSKMAKDFANWLIEKTKAPKLVVERRLYRVPKERHITAYIDEVPIEMGSFSGTYMTISRNCKEKENASFDCLMNSAGMFGMDRISNKTPLNMSFMAERIGASSGEGNTTQSEPVDLTPGPKIDISKPVVLDNLEDDLGSLFGDKES